MRDAMELARALDKPITAHCEDESLLTPGLVPSTTGSGRRGHGLPGNAPESEWRQVERDIWSWCAETGCRYHVCHISTKESVALIRQRQGGGSARHPARPAPHYLIALRRGPGWTTAASR